MTNLNKPEEPSQQPSNEGAVPPPPPAAAHPATSSFNPNQGGNPPYNNQPAYQQPYGYNPNQPAPWEPFAIVSFVLFFVFNVAGIGSIVFGHLALNRIKVNGKQGHGLALAGTILGYVSLLFSILWLFLIIVAAASGHMHSSYSTY